MITIGRERRQQGFWIVTSIILIPILLAFGVFSVSLNNLHLAQAELQAAADAAALAGARVLFIRNAQNESNNGKINVNGYTDKNGQTIASATNSATAAIQNNKVRGQATQTERIQIGHWEFMNTRTANIYGTSDGIERGGRFISIPSVLLSQSTSYALKNNLEEFVLFSGMTNSLNINPYQVNAIRVTTSGNASGYFFARFLNISDQFNLSATAVAYVGLASSARIGPPLAICQQAIQSSGRHNCSSGNYFQSTGYQWVRWTSLKPRGGPTLETAVSSLISGMKQCGGSGAGVEVTVGTQIEATHAISEQNFNNLYACWQTAGANRYWPLTLPVVDCEASESASGFEDQPRVLGFISANLLWMVKSDQCEQMSASGVVPTKMDNPNQSPTYDWDKTSEPDAQQRWGSFVDYFQIKRAAQSTATVKEQLCIAGKPAIYFAPQCNTVGVDAVITGKTGGMYNFGVRAAEPVLVY